MSELAQDRQYVPTDYDKRSLALHHANGDVEKAQKIYAFLTAGVDTVAPEPRVEPKADAKPKAPKAEKPVETASTAPAPPVEQPKADAPAKLDYATDVLPRVMGTVNIIACLPGKDITQGKAEVVAMMKAKFGVGNAKEVPEARWTEFLAELDALLAKAGVQVNG